MKAIVIAPKGGRRHDPLISQLSSIPSLQIELFPARMLNDIPSGFDMSRALSIHNFELLPGDIGCAMSHREVWMLIAESDEPWTLVFEDDARITSAGELANAIDSTTFLDNAMPIVLSLYTENAVVRTWPKRGFADCLTEPSFAVAYLLTRSAAQQLAEANTNLCFCSDWPRGSNVRFLLWAGDPVAHGDEESGTTVGNRQKNVLRKAVSHGTVTGHLLMNRFALYSFVHYFRYKRYFSGLSDYFRKVLKHRIVWHLARFALRRRRLKQGVYVASLRKNRASNI